MEGEPKGRRESGLSAEKAAEMLGVSTTRVEILAAQGRLKEGREPDAPRYDLDSVLSMQAEDLIRGMLAQAGGKDPKLREKIETLAALQYQRGREAADRAEHWEMLERMDTLVERTEKATREYLEEVREMNAAAESRMAEMRAMEEGLLRRMPDRERRTA